MIFGVLEQPILAAPAALALALGALFCGLCGCILPTTEQRAYKLALRAERAAAKAEAEAAEEEEEAGQQYQQNEQQRELLQLERNEQSSPRKHQGQGSRGPKRGQQQQQKREAAADTQHGLRPPE